MIPAGGSTRDLSVLPQAQLATLQTVGFETVRLKKLLQDVERAIMSETHLHAHAWLEVPEARARGGGGDGGGGTGVTGPHSVGPDAAALGLKAGTMIGPGGTHLSATGEAGWRNKAARGTREWQEAAAWLNDDRLPPDTADELWALTLRQSGSQTAAVQSYTQGGAKPGQPRFETVPMQRDSGPE